MFWKGIWRNIRSSHTTLLLENRYANDNKDAACKQYALHIVKAEYCVDIIIIGCQYVYMYMCVLYIRIYTTYLLNYR